MRHDAAQRRETPPNEGGAVVVEFAFVFIIFALLLSGLVSFGAAFAAKQSLTHAASEGARALVGFEGAVGDEDGAGHVTQEEAAVLETQAESAIEEAVMGQIAWLRAPDAVEALTVTRDATDCDGAVCYTVTVSGSSPVPEILPVFDGKNMSASATVKVD